MKLPNVRRLLFSVGLSFLASVSSIPIVLASVGLTPTLDFQKGRADALVEQSAIAHRNGDFNTALGLLQEASTLYQNLGDRAGLSNTLKQFGDIYFTQGEYRRAVNFYLQSLEIVQALGLRYREPELLANLSHAYQFLGDLQATEEFETRAEAARRQVEASQREAAFFSSLGVNYETQGEYAQAIALYQQQLAIAREVGDLQLATQALNYLAQAYESAQEHRSAIEIYQQQLTQARTQRNQPLEIQLLARIAQAYQAWGEPQQAIPFYQQQLTQARESSNRILELNTLERLGNLYELLAQFPQSIEVRQQQVDIAKRQSDRTLETDALNQLASTFLIAERPAEAQAILTEALQVWERLGTQSQSYARHATTYTLLQQALVAQNQPESALLIAQQEQLLSLSPLPNLPATSSLTRLKQIAQEQNATLVQYSLIRNLQNEPQAIYIWLIPPNGEIQFRQVEVASQNLPTLIRHSREILGLQPPKIPGEASSQSLLQLYILLIRPVADLLPQNPNQRLVFIPHKELTLIPFSALTDVTGTYLIEKYAISTIPAIQLLGLTRQNRQQAGGPYILAVGNTTRSGIDANTEQEIIEVAALNRVKPLFGEEATRTFLLPLLPKARIVHVATSGRLENAIALFPSTQDNSLLATNDILNLPLKAELVFLSLRDRQNITVENSHTLALSLISAGVPSVITPIGSISDDATFYFIQEFYKQLRRNRDKAQALRQSAILTLQKYPNSRTWAAFTLVGEAR
ncbi:MAG: CHAT domain-containing protein [Desertifilum sp. SIO1I2]|nr:CHAT domain-containing protein [Desertifilum sp. SIO1I2]